MRLALATSTAPGQPLMQSPIAADSVVTEGWVLKKRRKRMQGMFLIDAFM